MISFACGMCLDSSLLALVPFVPAWALLLLVWALGWGVVGNVATYRARARLSLQPLYYLIGAPVGAALLGILLPSVLLPRLLVLTIWLVRVAARPPLRSPGTGPQAATVERLAACARRITLSLAGLAVPVSYVLVHGQRVADLLPFGDWLLVPAPVAAAGSLVLAWAVWTALRELKLRERQGTPTARSQERAVVSSR